MNNYTYVNPLDEAARWPSYEITGMVEPLPEVDYQPMVDAAMGDIGQINPWEVTGTVGPSPVVTYVPPVERLCKNCVHWEDGGVWGKCLKSGAQSLLCGAGYFDPVFTKPDFGCVMFEG